MPSVGEVQDLARMKGGEGCVKEEKNPERRVVWVGEYSQKEGKG